MHTPCCSTCGRPYASGPCPRPSLDAPASPSRPRPPRPALPPYAAGFARRVRAFALATMLALGCKPNLPPVSGCEPFRGYCVHDRIATCSASQRLHVHGDLPCARVGGVCVVRDRVARCETIDGGVPDDALDVIELDGGVLPVESVDAEVPDGD